MADEATPPTSRAKSKQKRSQLLDADNVNRSVATQQNTAVPTLANMLKQSRTKRVNQFSEEEKKASKEKREQERDKDKENIALIAEKFKKEWPAGLASLGCDETTATSAQKMYDKQMTKAVRHLQVSTKPGKEPQYMFTGKESYFYYLGDEDGSWKFNGYGGLLTKTEVRNYLSDDVREPTLCAIEYVLTRPDKYCLKASSSPKWGAAGHCQCKCFIHLKQVLIVLCQEAYNEETNKVDKQLVPEVVVKYMENPVRFMLGMRTLSHYNARRDPDKFFRFLLQNVVVQNNEAAMGKEALVFQFPFFQEKEIGVGVLGGMRFCKGMLAEMCGSREPNTLTDTGLPANERKDKKPHSDLKGTLAFNDLCNIQGIYEFSKTNFDALSVNARKKMVGAPNRRRQIWRKVALRDLHCRLSTNAQVLKSIEDAKIAEGLTEMCEEVTSDKAYKHFQETSEGFMRETRFTELYNRIVGAIVAKGEDETRGKKAYVIADHNVCYAFHENLLERRPDLRDSQRWIPREPPSGIAKAKTANGEQKMCKNESIHIDVENRVKERIARLQQRMSENPNLLRHASAVAVTSKVPTVSHVSSSITPKIEAGDATSDGFHRFGLLGVVFPCKGEPFWKSKDVAQLNHDFDCCALKVPESTPLLPMCNGILSNSVGPKCLLRREFRRQNGNDNVFFVREGRTTEEFLRGSATGHWTSDDSCKRAAESLETKIGDWATAHGGEQDDKVSVRWFVTAIAPDLRSRTQEAPRLQLPISVLKQQEAKGNKVAVGLLPLAPQGHVCRYYPGPFILPDDDGAGGPLTVKYWESQEPNPWLGSFVHVRFGSILMGPATMLMSDGLHTTNGITPFAVALVIVGKEAAIDSTIDSQRLTLDCYFNCLAPIMPTTRDRERVAQLEKKIRESTFKYNKAMDLPTVVSITPANENPVHASLTPIRSVYLLTHFGPTMCYGGLENWENTDYQIRKEDITQDRTRKISKRDKKAAEQNSQPKTKALPKDLDEPDFSYKNIEVYNFKAIYDEPVKDSDDSADSEWSGEDDGSQASSDYKEIPQEPKKRGAQHKKAPEAPDSADEEE